MQRSLPFRRLQRQKLESPVFSSARFPRRGPVPNLLQPKPQPILFPAAHHNPPDPELRILRSSLPVLSGLARANRQPQYFQKIHQYLLRHPLAASGKHGGPLDGRAERVRSGVFQYRG